MDEEKKPSRIEAMKRALYTKNATVVRKDGILHPQSFDAPKTWKDDTVKKSESTTLRIPSTIYRKFFIGAVIFFILAILFGLFTFFHGSNTVSNDDIEIHVIGNAFAAGGESLPLQIEVVNKNNVPLELADLIVESPKGESGETSGDYNRQRFSLGTIAGGKSKTQNVELTLFGAEGAVRTIKATIEYRVKGSNAIFVKDTTYPVTISTAPLSLLVEGPEKLSSNQNFTLSIKVTSNAKETLENIVLEVNYPFGFSYKSATPSPSFNNDGWALGDLAPGITRTITLTGIIIGEEGDDRAFHVLAGSASEKDLSKIAIPFNSVLHTTTIEKAFLATDIVVGGSRDENPVIKSTEDVQIAINWANTLPTKLSNVEIRASLSGNAIDFNSVDTTDGFYNSNTHEVVFDGTSNHEFKSLEPGDEGTVTFSLRSLPLFGANQTLIESPTITITLSVKGRAIADGGQTTEVTNLITRNIRVSTDLSILAKALYFTGPFVNTGSIPPKAGSKTTYTITWSVTNTANAVRSGIVTATLPSYITWEGHSLPLTEGISFDPSSRVVTWKVGDIGKGAGFTSAPREVSFQIGLTPSTSQVGSIPELIRETLLEGQDTFTNTLLEISRSRLTATLFSDPGFPSGGDRVTN